MKRLLLGALCFMIALMTGMLAETDVSIPSLNFTPKAVPETDAFVFTRSIGLGWNLGNTFDATGGSWIRNEMDIETAWQKDKTAEALIDALCDAGFDTLRIPVSWHDHVNAAFSISEQWLDRVKEVVDWAYSRGMHVIVNIHHDCDKKYYYPSRDCLENSIAYVTAIWMQVSRRFKDYDERLIFENLNEPRLKDTAYEWNSDERVPEVADAMECINMLNQIFVDTVRASGGCNADRYLMVSGYDASIQGATSARFVLPADSAENRLIISTHAYAPYSFALQASSESGSRSVWSVENAADRQELALTLEELYQKFITKGIPVVMGEFGSRDKGGNLASRVDHAAFYVALCTARGIPCIWWDNNSFKGSGENFGLIRRSALKWEYPEIIQAMITYKLK